MPGNLGLSTPWARQALPESERAELRRLVPDGWTVGLSVLRPGRRYRAWANDDEMGEYALYIVERPTASAAIMAAIDWIRADA